MDGAKTKAVLNLLNKAFKGYNIDSRENAITLSYDFLIDTGTAKIIIKIGQKRWDDSDNNSIVNYLESKEQQISKALLDNESAILTMK